MNVLLKMNVNLALLNMAHDVHCTLMRHFLMCLVYVMHCHVAGLVYMNAQLSWAWNHDVWNGT